MDVVTVRCPHWRTGYCMQVVALLDMCHNDVTLVLTLLERPPVESTDTDALLVVRVDHLE